MKRDDTRAVSAGVRGTGLRAAARRRRTPVAAKYSDTYCLYNGESPWTLPYA